MDARSDVMLMVEGFLEQALSHAGFARAAFTDNHRTRSHPGNTFVPELLQRVLCARELGRFRIPDTHRLVVRARDNARPIVVERHGADPIGMPRQRGLACSGGRIPDTHRLVPRTRDNARPIVVERHGSFACPDRPEVSHGAHRRRGDGRSGWANQVTNKLVIKVITNRSIER